MTFLVTSDIHLTANPRDSHRFGLFPWLKQQRDKYKPKAIFILGDLTDAKDRHSSALVNTIVEGLRLLFSDLCPVFILMGNHDYINPRLPFFRFLNTLSPWVHFITEPFPLSKHKIAMIPHCPTQKEFDEVCQEIPEGWGVFLHQTISGAIGDNGAALAGFSAAVIRERKPRWVYSGDVHKPQQCGPVTYVGSPFHVHFGDQYTPRVLLLGDKETSLYFPAPRKLALTIRDVDDIPDLQKGDQVKITLELPRSEVVHWLEYKKAIADYCKESEVEIYGLDVKVPKPRKRMRLDDAPANLTDKDYFDTFCKAEKVAHNIKETGVELL